jgi:hypothetical protein
MVVVFRIRNKGNRLFIGKLGGMFYVEDEV